MFAAQGLVVFALELPTGGLSDALGRRPVLLLAGVVGHRVARAVHGRGTRRRCSSRRWSCRASTGARLGPLEAWFVDATLAADPAAEIEHGLGRGTAALSLAIAVGALAIRRTGRPPPAAGASTRSCCRCWSPYRFHIVSLAAVAPLMTETPRARAPGGDRGVGPCRPDGRPRRPRSAELVACAALRSSWSRRSGASRWSPSRACSRSACRSWSAAPTLPPRSWAR